MSKYLIDIGGFTIAPDHITDEYSFLTAGVYGKIWRYEQMEAGVCRAALETMADDLGINQETLRVHIHKLIDGGYVIDRTPGLCNRPHIYQTSGKLKLQLALTTDAENPLPPLAENPRVLAENPLPGNGKSASETRKIRVESDSLRDSLRDNLREGEYPPANPASLCESVYRKVTGQPSIPADNRRNDALRNLETVLESYSWKIDDKMIDEGKQIFAQWCSTISEKTGRGYSRLNTAWLGKWLEQLAPVPEATHGIGQQTDLERAMARIHAAAQER